MTECERFIKTGRFKEEFFKEEVRCDFKVDKNRKKLWAVLLDMLLMFDEVCRKHNLKYFIAGGTLLGAIRHKGFIPWDDDVDIAMLREDYEKLLTLAGEFKEPYFFQTPYTDPGYLFTFAKIRNSNTSAISEMFLYQPMNHGVCLDIFPLDNWSTEGGEERYETLRKINYECSTYMRLTNPRLDEKNKLRVQNYCGAEPLELYEKMQKTAMHSRNTETEYIISAMATHLDYSKKLFRAKDYKYAVYTDFEGYSLPINNGYEYSLRTEYGDYMKLPPVEERGNWHAGEIIDPDIPYREYVEKILKEEK